MSHHSRGLFPTHIKTFARRFQIENDENTSQVQHNDLRSFQFKRHDVIVAQPWRLAPVVQVVSTLLWVSNEL